MINFLITTNILITNILITMKYLGHLIRLKAFSWSQYTQNFNEIRLFWKYHVKQNPTPQKTTISFPKCLLHRRSAKNMLSWWHLTVKVPHRIGNISLQQTSHQPPWKHSHLVIRITTSQWPHLITMKTFSSQWQHPYHNENILIKMTNILITMKTPSSHENLIKMITSFSQRCHSISIFPHDENISSQWQTVKTFNLWQWKNVPPSCSRIVRAAVRISKWWLGWFPIKAVERDDVVCMVVDRPDELMLLVNRTERQLSSALPSTKVTLTQLVTGFLGAL